MRCKLCGQPMTVLDEWGQWAGEPAHATPCAKAAREALQEIADHAVSKSRSDAAQRFLRRVA